METERINKTFMLCRNGIRIKFYYKNLITVFRFKDCIKPQILCILGNNVSPIMMRPRPTIAKMCIQRVLVMNSVRMQHNCNIIITSVILKVA